MQIPQVAAVGLDGATRGTADVRELLEKAPDLLREPILRLLLGHRRMFAANRQGLKFQREVPVRRSSAVPSRRSRSAWPWLRTTTWTSPSPLIVAVHE